MISDTCGYVLFLLLLLMIPYIESGESLSEVFYRYAIPAHVRRFAPGTRPARAFGACEAHARARARARVR